MRAFIRSPIPLSVAGEEVDFLAIRRREHLLIPHPHAGHAQLLPILGDINHAAFLTADINPHYVPSTTNVT